MKALIVYYSYGGNTRRIAELLQKQTGADMAEIQTQTPYTGSYNVVVEQGQDEVRRGYMPPIRPLAVNPADYDAILLGTPVWWYTFAPAVKTFLHDYPLTGKTIDPFATNGGWIGHTFRDIRTACPGATVKSGLNIRFDEHTLRTPERDIREWAAKLEK